MTSVGIVANGDKISILEGLTLLKEITGLKIVFVKQSNEKLYIVTEKVFDIANGG